MTNATQSRPTEKEAREKKHRVKRDETPFSHEALQIILRIRQEKAQ